MPVEKTSKPLKLAQLLTLLMVVGSLGGGFYLQTTEGMYLAGYGAAAGLAGYLLVRIVGWWQYG
jgi:hypothetical protein